jgi:hypothetical protein
VCPLGVRTPQVENPNSIPDGERGYFFLNLYIRATSSPAKPQTSQPMDRTSVRLEPISYRGALLTTLLHVSLILTSHNRPRAYSYRGALLTTLLHVSLIPTSHNRPSTYQLQRSSTDHSSTCKSHSHNPQRAQCLSVTEELY